MKTRLLRDLVLLVTVVSFQMYPHSTGAGTISGKVVDVETGEPIIGANIVIEGILRGASADIDGRFNIAGLSSGNYSLVVSALSFGKKHVANVSVEEGKTTMLTVALPQESITTQEVVVEAKAMSSFEGVLLAKQKNASAISDGISAEQIRRTPDATSGDALRRLTGISLVDNKYVFIRGITDRYNQTTLNGTTVTSTDPDKKSFSFDILPANLLENTVVVKSATPDMRGDFTGGLVQLNTLDFPDKPVLKLSTSSGYNSITTGNEFDASTGGSQDWLGVDDGTRAFPDGTVAVQQVAHLLPNTWAPHVRKAPFNESFSLSYGNTLSIERESGVTDEVGFVGAVTYRNSFQRNDKMINDEAMGRSNVGTRDDFSVLWGALANVSYKFDGLHKLSLNTNYNQNAEDQVGRFLGNDQNTSLENRFTVVSWNQRSMSSGQLTGEHNVPLFGGLILDWRASISTSKRSVPDRKEATYYRALDDPTGQFQVATNQRSWSDLNDHSTSLLVNVLVPVASGMKVKLGLLDEGKRTDYRIRYFNVRPDYIGGATEILTTAPLEAVYNANNFGPGKFIFEESSKASDSYDADSRLYAAYAMIDAPFSVFDNKFRFVGGTRLENSEQRIRVPRTIVAGGPVDQTQVKNVDLLPSMNFTYFVNEWTNLRLAFSHSVNRPEFRELASTGFYDFIKYEMVGGNPDLKRSYARNYDVRLEFFPEAGELMAISYFHKNITDAIEEKLIQTATRTRTWFNSDRAANDGWEFEVRKSLGFIGGFYKCFSITGNYTRIQSRVEVYQTVGNSINTQTQITSRPMQGQSPYMLNLSFLFTEPSVGTSVSLLYNKFGRRLDAVGFLASDIYEESRDLVDLAISQPVFLGLEAKFTVKNLNNSERLLTRDGVLYERTATGKTYSVQLSQTF